MLPYVQYPWTCHLLLNAGVRQKNNENVITLSDYKLHSFAAATATYLEELGLLTRAVFVVDKDNILRYVEYVREITDEPDYEAVLSCVKGI